MFCALYLTVEREQAIQEEREKRLREQQDRIQASLHLTLHAEEPVGTSAKLLC